MDINDLKRYSVIVQGGSGVLFQPMNNNEYTYILSARHNFYSETNLYETINIEISNSLINIKSELIEKLKTFKIKEGENYFPHKEADIAIVLIEYIEGFDRIIIESNCKVFNNVLLCGFPDDNRKNQELKTIEEKFSTVGIEREINPTDYNIRVELNRYYDDQPRIVGFSGGGLLRLDDDYISIIGIQSEVTSSLPNGQIEFVPVKFFNEIIEDPKNKGKLAQLLPPYMGNFEFLKDKAFNINASIYDEHISYTRSFLKRKTKEVIESDITPYYIKSFFKERLLLNEQNQSILETEIIYITWLEFLTIMNIAKGKQYNKENLAEIFYHVRLFYKNTENDWLDGGFLKECLVANYKGLNESGTVLIKTYNRPCIDSKELYMLPRKSIIPRIDRMRQDYLKGNLEVRDITNAVGELDVFVFDIFNFIHFEYLKHFMICVNHSDFEKFNRLNEVELLYKLRDEYGRLFGTKE